MDQIKIIDEIIAEFDKLRKAGLTGKELIIQMNIVREAILDRAGITTIEFMDLCDLRMKKLSEEIDKNQQE